MPKAGRKRGRAFTPKQADAIRARYLRGDESQQAIADWYGVTRETIRDVVLRLRAYADTAATNKE